MKKRKINAAKGGSQQPYTRTNKKELVEMRHARLILAGLGDKLVLGVSKGKQAHASKLMRELDAMTIAGAVEGEKSDRAAIVYFFGTSVLAGLCPNDVDPNNLWDWLGTLVALPKFDLSDVTGMAEKEIEEVSQAESGALNVAVPEHGAGVVEAAGEPSAVAEGGA